MVAHYRNSVCIIARKEDKFLLVRNKEWEKDLGAPKGDSEPLTEEEKAVEAAFWKEAEDTINKNRELLKNDPSWQASQARETARMREVFGNPDEWNLEKQKDQEFFDSPETKKALNSLVNGLIEGIIEAHPEPELQPEPEPLAPPSQLVPRPIKETVCPVTGMEFVWVPGGSFQMGDAFGEGDGNEKPVHEVCVSDFWLGKYEVTQAQWEAVMGDNPSIFKGDNLPVEYVSWEEVQKFIQKLNTQTDGKHRLPTEAEWEYACREAGRKVRFGNGKDRLDPREANYHGIAVAYAVPGENREKTTPVGSFAPNGLGLYDMSGNVKEWVGDWYGDYSNGKQTNPTGPSRGSDRVTRGGSWYCYPFVLRCSARLYADPGFRTDDIGFRLVRTGP